jgi:hypothetical protein
VADVKELVDTLKIDEDPLLMSPEEVTQRMAQEEKEVCEPHSSPSVLFHFLQQQQHSQHSQQQQQQHNYIVYNI